MEERRRRLALNEQILFFARTRYLSLTDKTLEIAQKLNKLDSQISVLDRRGSQWSLLSTDDTKAVQTFRPSETIQEKANLQTRGSQKVERDKRQLARVPSVSTSFSSMLPPNSAQVPPLIFPNSINTKLQSEWPA